MADEALYHSTATTARASAISRNIRSWLSPITRRCKVSSSAPVSSQGICTTQVGARLAMSAISSRPSPASTDELLRLVASVPHWMIIHYIVAFTAVSVVSGLAQSVGVLAPSGCVRGDGIKPNGSSRVNEPSLLARRTPGVPMRVLRWARAWVRRDPSAAHWHLGPVAVDAHVPGRGIGGQRPTTSPLMSSVPGRPCDVPPTYSRWRRTSMPPPA